MRIDAGLDTGDMLLKAETEIGPEENAVELGERLAVMGADLLVETLRGLATGTIAPEKQDSAQATLRAAAQEGRRADRLDAARRRDPQPRARAAAVAGRVHRLSRPVCCTSGSRGRDGRFAGLPGCIVSVKPPVVAAAKAALELIEVHGRPQADDRRRFRQRPAPGRE